jgi:hypothetical protein
MLKLTKVQSSQIEAVGHDGERLFILFKTKKARSLYAYRNVTPEKHQLLVNAESIGKHFADNIKAEPDLYPYERIGDEVEIEVVEPVPAAETMRLWGTADGRFTGKEPRFPNNAEYMEAFNYARSAKVANG